MKVIGISGKAGFGKDFCASITQELAEKEFGLRTCVWSLAHTLKARAYAEAKGDLTFEDVWFNKPPALRKLLQEIGTEKGRNVFGDEFWLLQAEAYFKLFTTAANIELVIVPDIRFPNEIQFAQYGGRAPTLFRQRLMSEAASLIGYTPDLEAELLERDPTGLLEMESTLAETFMASLMGFEHNGRCYRIKSDRPTLTGDAAKHPSETSLDNVGEGIFDGYIYNNLSTTEKDLEGQILAYLIPYLGYKKEK